MRAIAAAVIVLAASAMAGGQAGDLLLAVDLGTHLQPIAQMRDGAWVAMPRTGLGRLAPRDWTRWDLAGRAAPIRLSVREPSGRCAAPRRLPVAESRAGSGPSILGIAASGPLSIEPGVAVSSGSADFRHVHAAVLPLFERREREQGLSPAAVARLPVTLDRAFRSGGATAGSYYFEASKRIPDAGGTPEEDPIGIVRLTVSGWLRGAGDRLAPAGSKGELHWDPVDERANIPPQGLRPLAVFRDRTEQIWVMHDQAGMRESFTLYALGDTVRRLLTAEAAAC